MLSAREDKHWPRQPFVPPVQLDNTEDRVHAGGCHGECGRAVDAVGHLSSTPSRLLIKSDSIRCLRL